MSAFRSKANPPVKSLLDFWSRTLKPYFRLLLLAQLFSLSWTLDFTVWPHLTRWLIDTILLHADEKMRVWEFLTIPLIVIGITWLLIEVMFRLQGFTLAKLFPATEAAIREAMLHYTSLHGYQFFSDHFSGAVANKINDMPSSTTEILRTILTLFVPSFTAFLIAIVSFAMIQPGFAMIIGGWLVVHLGVCFLTANRSNELAQEHSEKRSLLTGVIVDSFTNAMTIKMFARRKEEFAYIKRFQTAEMEAQKTSLIYIEKIKIVLGILCFLGPGVLLIWWMIHRWQYGLISVGEVVLIFNTSWNIMMMAWLTGLELPNVFKHAGVCKQALTIMKIPHAVVDVPKATPLHLTQGGIVFDQVSFFYQRNYNLFENVSITIPPGQKVGLVGFSGSGKTTFVNLILRYFDIAAGEIRLDGQNIAIHTQESIREQIATIPQEPLLFHRTIMENIRFGKLDASDEQVMEAARKAHCHEFIMQLPGGYHSEVGERGIKLSGGQRQRIAIARAMIKDAKILILDEATSALDSITERYIQHSLLHLMQHRTTIVIAHRLSTLIGMDRILVFDKGSIIEDGTHDTLLSAGGHYAQLWKMQIDGFLPHSEQQLLKS